MKKLTSFILILACVLSLVGCSKAQTDNTTAAEEEKWDLIPMVMVDGEVYMTTGYSNPDVQKSEIPDGEITSSVDGSERPTMDDQSNFGEGYEYRYGDTKGTVEIYMNHKWWIYATEEAREKGAFRGGEMETISFHDRTFYRSDLSQDTYKWLVWYNGLSEEEQLSVSSIPAELYELGGYSELEDTVAVETE